MIFSSLQKCLFVSLLATVFVGAQMPGCSPTRHFTCPQERESSMVPGVISPTPTKSLAPTPSPSAITRVPSVITPAPSVVAPAPSVITRVPSAIAPAPSVTPPTKPTVEIPVEKPPTSGSGNGGNINLSGGGIGPGAATATAVGGAVLVGLVVFMRRKKDDEANTASLEPSNVNGEPV